jgi:hypothetical protein
MPSTSDKQHRFMEAVAHGWKPSHEEGPSVDVAKDFVAADKGSTMDEHAIKGHALRAVTDALTRATAEHVKRHMEKKKAKKKTDDGDLDEPGAGPFDHETDAGADKPGGGMKSPKGY